MLVTICYIIACILMAVGIFMILKLTPVQITQDLMDLIRPVNKLRTMSEDVKAKRRRGGIYGELQRIRNTMEATGRGKLFPLALTSVFGFAALGIVIGIMMDNIWIIPSLAVGLGAIPFLYMNSAVEFYEKSVRDELETALSIITNSYILSDDLIDAVRKNLEFIKPPLRGAFEKFVQDSVIMPSNKEIIIRLRERLDDQVFYEWCTTLLQCQDDRTLRENLNPVINKLTDIRLVNTQVAAVVSSAKAEYFAMVGFVVGSVPLLAVVSPGTINVLLTTTVGKMVAGIVSAITLFTFFRMRKATKTIDFDSK